MKKKRNNFIHQPTFPGGLKALRQLIKDNLVYPKAAIEAKIEGKVFVKYVVNAKGDVIQTSVAHGLGYGCDEEALRLVKLFKFNIKKTRGLKLKYNKSIRIHFKFAKATKAQIKQTAQPISQLSYTVTQSKDSKKVPPKSGNLEYEINL